MILDLVNTTISKEIVQVIEMYKASFKYTYRTEKRVLTLLCLIIISKRKDSLL